MLAQNQWPLLRHSPAHRHWRFLSACPMAVLGTHLARMVRAIFAQLGELLFGFLVQVVVVDGCTSDSESY